MQFINQKEASKKASLSPVRQAASADLQQQLRVFKSWTFNSEKFSKHTAKIVNINNHSKLHDLAQEVFRFDPILNPQSAAVLGR